MTAIMMTVPGAPVAKARPRFQRSGKVHTEKNTKRWETLAKIYARQAMRGVRLFECPVSMSVEVYFDIPASWPLWRKAEAADGRVWHVGTPDLDNIIKIAGDALNGVVFKDDSLVVCVHGHKSYSDNPRVEIAITPLGGLTGSSKRVKQ